MIPTIQVCCGIRSYCKSVMIVIDNSNSDEKGNDESHANV